MIVSTDLDRTLIFSRRRLDPAGPITIPMEYRQGKPFGFITPTALERLAQILRCSVLFLNTFRGLEQARRVIFTDDCHYLALQNGLYLYCRGAEDRDYSARVRQTVSALPLGLGDGAARVQRELPGIACISKQYEYLAVFFVEKSAFDDTACAALARELNGQGWDLVRQRKKLYMFPLAIDKGTVLQRVRDREDGAEALGFGDSGFDWPMLRLCTAAWSLRGSELWQRRSSLPAGFLRFSSAPAQAGTEEVLGEMLDALGFPQTQDIL